jgi:hypothetical protein
MLQAPFAAADDGAHHRYYSADQVQRPRRRRRRKAAPAGFATIAALAERGEVARSSLYDAVKRGELPAFRHRGVLVVRESDYHRAFAAVIPINNGTEAAP